MIKATGTNPKNGLPVLFVGLSNENVRRLQAGEPIMFETLPMGLPAMEVVILHGPTEEQIEASMQPMMRPTTVRHAHDVRPL